MQISLSNENIKYVSKIPHFCFFVCKDWSFDFHGFAWTFYEVFLNHDSLPPVSWPPQSRPCYARNRLILLGFWVFRVVAWVMLEGNWNACGGRGVAWNKSCATAGIDTSEKAQKKTPENFFSEVLIWYLVLRFTCYLGLHLDIIYSRAIQFITKSAISIINGHISKMPQKSPK